MWNKKKNKFERQLRYIVGAVCKRNSTIEFYMVSAFVIMCRVQEYLCNGSYSFTFSSNITMYWPDKCYSTFHNFMDLHYREKMEAGQMYTSMVSGTTVDMNASWNKRLFGLALFSLLLRMCRHISLILLLDHDSYWNKDHCLKMVL